MSDMKRRQFLKKLGTTAGAASASLLIASDGLSQDTGKEKPLLRRSSPNAVALGYHDDNTRIDPGKWPKYADGQRCERCQLFSANGDGSGNCNIFPRHRVAATGWCNAWLGA